MRLIATKSFRRTPALKAVEIEGAKHESHIHKGAVFDIGAGEDLRAMRKADRDSAELIGVLSLAECVAPATPTNIARVEAELELERQRVANQSRQNTAAANKALAQALGNVMQDFARQARI